MKNRTNIGEIGQNVGSEVYLYGWVNSRRDHGKITFIDLRDRSGLVQVVFTSDIDGAKDLRSEYVVKLRGLVKERPENMVNPDQPNGAFEIEAKELQIISEAGEIPLPIDTAGYDIKEEVRLKYRYLDLRRGRLAINLKVRHEVIHFMRNFLSERGFIEVETPILTKSTPEGARDYLVPSRVYPGSFYALPQSPQQYKQLLMVAGVERYFQISRCFRDEDARGDRQPEFSQLDMEMSFVTEEEIFELIEEMYTEMVTSLFPTLNMTDKKLSASPFPRITYAEAMEKYNTDKPDLRADKDDPNELAFAFITDFPAFEWNEKQKRWDSSHHPFTMIKEEDIKHLESGELGSIRSRSYDLVLNGYELASGSIRISDPELQRQVFKALGLSDEEITEKFGHMIEAFKYGTPPHGGIAPGIDRFIMIIQNEPNIREVIAFPKLGDGYDPMMDSPSPVDGKQLDDLGIEIKKKDE